MQTMRHNAGLFRTERLASPDPSSPYGFQLSEPGDPAPLLVKREYLAGVLRDVIGLAVGTEKLEQNERFLRVDMTIESTAF